jgi:hypothetical protein
MPEPTLADQVTRLYERSPGLTSEAEFSRFHIALAVKA